MIKGSKKKRLEKLEEKIRNIDALPSGVIFYDSELTLPDLSLDCNRGLIFLPYKEKSELD